MTSGYGSFARDELDREYSPSSLADDMPAELASWARDSEQARAATAWSELRYGPGTGELLDLFPAAGTGGPLLVFVHGGYWTELSKRESAFLAPGLVSADVSYAALDYPLAPSSSLDSIVDACEQAVGFLLDHGPRLGFDHRRVHLLGHSAGAQLAAMVATGRLADRIRGLIAVSGVFDLEPIRLSYVNDWLGLDQRAAARNSPVRRVRGGLPPLVAGYAERDTAEFRRQSEDLCITWARSGNQASLIQVPARDHFTVMRDCADPATGLGHAIFDQLSPAPGGSESR